MRDFFWDKVSSLVSSGSLYNFHDNLHSNLGILYVGEKFYWSSLSKLNVYSGITEIIGDQLSQQILCLFICLFVKSTQERSYIIWRCLIAVTWRRLFILYGFPEDMTKKDSQRTCSDSTQPWRPFWPIFTKERIFTI